jgi:hypothetical protein
MSHFFNCIEEKIIDELDKISNMLYTELDETCASSEDFGILKDLGNVKAKLVARINRETDRCSEPECIRKSNRFDRNGESKCRYH